ncbi:MarR family winged helix-turn-helix transcriptional regulator [Paracoccus laeviglucosivorans]|uniref:DNA-binding transcriptional regulator, MarR family n=1 Tax=Paracoccus laeviglucosivorans TaxID=1197861 RepID=A0A521FVR2_9RHOB|nr:MarR family transcriptional regulator [Paracoccus laeviglucosivorans]SMO99760.1 DNA-binding transcriptional regulator, MarR family [Paracoccus laeviglucosivorans]
MALTALRQIVRNSESSEKAVMRQTGLTPSQLVFMHLLEETGEATAGRIAGMMGITQATATVLIQKLENARVISRRKGEADRRQSWISLTPHGHALLAMAPDSANAQFHQKFAALQRWEQAMLVAALERVAGMMHAAEPDVDNEQ